MHQGQFGVRHVIQVIYYFQFSGLALRTYNDRLHSVQDEDHISLMVFMEASIFVHHAKMRMSFIQSDIILLFKLKAEKRLRGSMTPVSHA